MCDQHNTIAIIIHYHFQDSFFALKQLRKNSIFAPSNLKKLDF
ncbi:unnamed protein product [Paramecium octaurelia]|uniref:Uncharacterized protein n=1 Tax=Paramecium octaurelia TaxID=43137 RepID=A0A8S1TRB2_PAROT|nr:unnamed protein product [Paramecium octaurelia]CAD8199256.1 unnamed protein product [Paramecium octaurelia]